MAIGRKRKRKKGGKLLRAYTVRSYDRWQGQARQAGRQAGRQADG